VGNVPTSSSTKSFKYERLGIHAPELIRHGVVDAVSASTEKIDPVTASSRVRGRATGPRGINRCRSVRPRVGADIVAPNLK
jgi:hypothetical protein